MEFMGSAVSLMEAEAAGDLTFRAVINPGEARVKQDTDSALCNTAHTEGEGSAALEGGERVKSVRFACFEISPSFSLLHTIGPCAAATSRAAAESNRAREEERGEGRGWGRRERERVRAEQGESMGGDKARGRGNSGDYRENKH